MKPSVYAPMYCALYPQLSDIVRGHGYALAVHGSLQRDMDLICIPWIGRPDAPSVVVEDITTQLAIRRIGLPEVKEHGREAWTISIGHGECAIDLSFMPKLTPENTKLIHFLAGRRNAFEEAAQLVEIQSQWIWVDSPDELAAKIRKLAE